MIQLIAAASSDSFNTTAIVAIVAGAVISLIGSGVAVWVHRSQLRFQRGETDRAEVKAILDAIVENIYQAQMLTGELQAIEFYAGNEADPSARWKRDAAPYAPRLNEIRLTLLSDLTRLGLRLGTASTTMAQAVGAAANDIQAVATMALSKIGVRDHLRQHHEAIQDCRLKFSEQAQAFTLAKLIK